MCGRYVGHSVVKHCSSGLIVVDSCWGHKVRNVHLESVRCSSHCSGPGGLDLLMKSRYYNTWVLVADSCWGHKVRGVHLESIRCSSHCSGPGCLDPLMTSRYHNTWGASSRQLLGSQGARGAP